MSENHKNFITYVRTCQFWQLRIKNANSKSSIHIPKKVIQERFFPFPKFDVNNELNYLIQLNEIQVSKDKIKNGNEVYYYEAIKSGNINLELLKTSSKELDELEKSMMNILMLVSLPKEIKSNLFFDVFMKYRNYNLKIFFTIDNFGGRIYTPITSLKKDLREKILINNEKTISLDVVTMQPLLLSNILKKQIGKNEFTETIEAGKDIYLMIQEKAKLKNRDEAKEKYYQIMYGKTNNDLSLIFGNANWIDWINNFKTIPFKHNPRTHEKPNSNLSWLLQSYEVKTMRKIWNKLMFENIPFLTVHDEIIVCQKDEVKTFQIMNEIFENEFIYHKISKTK
jgi:hypothetical protein